MIEDPAQTYLSSSPTSSGSRMDHRLGKRERVSTKDKAKDKRKDKAKAKIKQKAKPKIKEKQNRNKDKTKDKTKDQTEDKTDSYEANVTKKDASLTIDVDGEAVVDGATVRLLHFWHFDCVFSLLECSQLLRMDNADRFFSFRFIKGNFPARIAPF